MFHVTEQQTENIELNSPKPYRNDNISSLASSVVCESPADDEITSCEYERCSAQSTDVYETISSTGDQQINVEVNDNDNSVSSSSV